MVYFLTGFFLTLLLNLGYCLILLFNEKHGHKANWALYGLTWIADYRRLRTNLAVQEKNQLFQIIVIADVMLTALAGFLMYFGISRLD